MTDTNCDCPHCDPATQAWEEQEDRIAILAEALRMISLLSHPITAKIARTALDRAEAWKAHCWDDESFDALLHCFKTPESNVVQLKPHQPEPPNDQPA